VTSETHLQLLERLEAADDPERAILESTLALAEEQDGEFARALRLYAIPRRLNPEVVGVLMERPDEHAENAALLERIAQMSFVIRREDGDLVYHDNVRDILLADWLDPANRNEFAACAQALVDLYEAKHNQIADLERALMRVSWVIRRANDDRYVQLMHALESRLVSPLLDALYYASLISADDGYSLFSKYVESYERAGRIGVCRALVATLRDQLQRIDRPEAAGHLVWLQYWDGRVARDAGDQTLAESIFRSIDPGDDVRLRTWLLSDLGTTLYERDRYEEARLIYEEELALSKATMVDPWNLTVAYQHLGQLAWTVDDLPRARECYGLAVEVAAERDNVVGESYAALALSGILAQLGEFEEAFATALRALDLARTRQTFDRPLQRAVALQFMTLLATYEPRLLETLRKEAHVLQPPEDAVAAANFELSYLAALREARRPVSAEEAFELAGRPEEGVVGSAVMHGFLIQQASHAEASGDYTSAIAALTKVLESPTPSRSHQGVALVYRGILFGSTGRWNAAARDFEAALGAWQAMGSDAMVATVHVQIARLDVARGRLDEAEARLAEWGPRAEAIASSLVGDYYSARGELHRARGQLSEAVAAYGQWFDVLDKRRRLEAGRTAADLASIAALRADWVVSAAWSERAADVWNGLRTAASYRQSSEERDADRQNADALRIYCSPNGEAAAARDLLLSAIKSVPENMWYALNLAYMLAGLGEWGGAADACERAYASAPLPLPSLLQVLANYRLQQTRDLLAHGDPASAVEVSRSARVRLDGAPAGPELAQLMQTAGDAEFALGRLDAAAAEYRAALESSEHYPLVRASVLVRLAATEAESRKVDTTAALLRKAVDALRDGGDADAWWSLVSEGAAVAREGRFGEAMHRVVRDLVEGDRVTTFSSEIATPLPPGWAARESMTFFSPDGSSTLIVSSGPLEGAMTAREYADVSLPQLQALDRFEELSFEQVELPGGLEAYVRRFTWAIVEDDVSIVQFQVHFVVGERGYTATGTMLEAGTEIEAQLIQVALGIAVRRAEPETARS